MKKSFPASITVDRPHKYALQAPFFDAKAAHIEALAAEGKSLNQIMRALSLRSDHCLRRWAKERPRLYAMLCANGRARKNPKGATK